MEKKQENFGVGRRKTAVSSVHLRKGTGKIDQTGQVFLADSGFAFLPGQVNLDQDLGFPPGLPGPAVDLLGQVLPIERMDEMETLDRFPGFFPLQVTDKMPDDRSGEQRLFPPGSLQVIFPQMLQPGFRGGPDQLRHHVFGHPHEGDIRFLPSGTLAGSRDPLPDFFQVGLNAFRVQGSKFKG